MFKKLYHYSYGLKGSAEQDRIDHTPKLVMNKLTHTHTHTLTLSALPVSVALIEAY